MFLGYFKYYYTANNLNSIDIRGGAENVIINLYQELVKFKNDVDVFNNGSASCDINGVRWNNIRNINKDIVYNVVFTNNDIKLFD